MTINLLEAPLVKSLLDETIPFHEVMNAFDIKTSIAFNLPSGIHGFVYVSKRENYHIILNGNIGYEAQCRTFAHEVKHIIKDLPQVSYIIGLDMQHIEMELEAKQFKIL